MNVGQLLEHYEPLLISGFKTTVYLSIAVLVASSVIGLVLGILVSNTTEYPSTARRVGQGVIKWYVGIFRAVPLLILLFLVYFGIPEILHISINKNIAAFVALSLFYGAYQTEVMRTGVEGVPRGQWEAGRALGLNQLEQIVRVVLPQALRISIPIATTQWVAAVKNTSLASAIGMTELTLAASTIQQVSFSASATWIIFGGLAVVYLGLCFLTSLIGSALERWFGRHTRSSAGRGPDTEMGEEALSLQTMGS